MVRIATIARYFALTLLLAGLVATARGQEMKEAADLYNGAASSFQQKPDQAAKDLEKCIEICGKLETEESKDLATRAKGILPRVHFQRAKVLFGQGKVDESIAAMEKARDIASENKDEKTVKMIERTIPAIYFKQALTEEKAQHFDKAIEMCQKALSCNERYLDAYIVLANCQDSVGQFEEMLNTLMKGIETSKKAGDVARQMDMRIIATNYLKREADAQQKAKKHEEVVKLLTRATEFDDRDPLVYQTIAVSQAALKNNDEVIRNADLAIEYATATMEKEQVYFLKAKALQAKGMVQEACQAYKNAAKGQFKDAAEREMKEVLKCK